MNNTTDLAMEQELNLIGALLKDPSKIDYVKEIITPDDIWLERARDVYKAMVDLRSQELVIDTVTVGDELERHDQLEAWGGRIGLQRVRQEFRGDAPDSYAWLVLDYSAKRKMIMEFSTGANWSNNGRKSSSIRDDMIRRLTDIKTPNTKANKHTQTFKEALSQNYDEVNNGNVSFVPTGFIDIDRVLDGGLYAPDLMIVAGRPGTGKTSLMLSVAINAAKKDKRVVLFSLEMANTQIVMRAASMETGVSFGAMRSRKMTQEQKIKYNEFIESFEHLPIHLNDMPAISVNSMRQTLREISAVHGDIDLVIVDYLQLQGVDSKFGNRQEEVSSISRGLKAMAKEFDVPVIAGAQLSRAVDSRAEKKPILSDLRESGSIEQDSDIVTFIHVSDEYNKNSMIDFIFAKHRNGAVGSVPLKFKKELTKFENGVKMYENN